MVTKWAHQWPTQWYHPQAIVSTSVVWWYVYFLFKFCRISPCQCFRVYIGNGPDKYVCRCKFDKSWKKCKRPKKPTTIPWLLAHTADRNGHWRGALGRMHEGELFPTIITIQAPMRSEGRILHPTKERCVTIRELARGQTFPDSFVFDLDCVAALRQVSAKMKIISWVTFSFQHLLMLLSSTLITVISCKSSVLFALERLNF